jgi:hypothetical protein
VKRALALLLALIATAASAQEEGIFDIRISSIPETRSVRVLLNEAGLLLFPLREIAAFLEIPLPPPHELPGLDSSESLATESEIFVSAAALARIVGGRTVVDWENLELVITGAVFPVELRRRNEQRRLTAIRGGPQFGEPDVPYEARSGGAAATWGISGSYDGLVTRGSARAVVGTAILGGALEAGYQGAVGSDRGGSEPWGRFTRAFPQSEWLRQIQIGDVRGGGIVSRAFLGVSVTNEPLYSPLSFGDALLQPIVPAGWEYEIYQGDYLLGVSTPGGSDPVIAPLGYGTTPLRIRMIGPGGQERTEDLTFLIPAIQVPAGEWRYAAGAGNCRADDCESLGYFDLRRGLTRTVTAGLGLDHLTGDRFSAGTRPHGMLSVLVRPDLRVEVRGQAESLARALVQQYRRSGGWTIGGGWQRNDSSATSAPDGIWFADGTGAWHRSGGSTTIVSARLRGTDPGSPDYWQAGVITGVSRFHGGISYESGLQSADVLSLTARALVGRRPGRPGREWNVNARLDVAEQTLHGGALTATVLPTERASVTAGVVWRAGSNEPEFSVMTLLRTRGAYVQNRAFTNRGRGGAFVSAGGGLALDDGELFVDPFETLSRTGVRGVAFVDGNGNGVRDPGEPVLGGIAVVIGGERAVTASDGTYRVWGLAPYVVVSAAVDLSATHRTDLAPARGESMVRLTPNVLAVVDLPLVYTREVTGEVRWSRGSPAAGGITVEARRGEGPAFRALTFSDGVFYFDALPAGDYTLTIAESSLTALGAVVEGPSVTLTIPGVASQSVLTAPPIHLERRTELEQEAQH